VARVKALELAVVQAWLSAWNERDIFSDAAVRHLQSLIADTRYFVVVTLGVGREPRSLVFRRWKYVLPASSPIIVPTRSKMISPPQLATATTGRTPPKLAHFSSDQAAGIRHFGHFFRRDIRSMSVSPVAPVAPPMGQLWHQTGVELERVLEWDGADWAIVGHVIDSPNIMKQGTQPCDFLEALACARDHAKRLDCEFIYTYDGSTWGNA
jgi:hypothetical protein